MHICIANAWVQLTTHISTPRGRMAELAMVTDIQRTVYSEEVTRQLHVMARTGKVRWSYTNVLTTGFLLSWLQKILGLFQDSRSIFPGACSKLAMFKYCNEQHLGNLGDAASSSCRVRCRAPAAKAFLAYLQPRRRTWWQQFCLFSSA